MADETLKPSPKKKTGHIRTGQRGPGQRLTAAQRVEAQTKFLKSFAANGNVRVACMAAGIDRSTVHGWTEHDEQFSMQYNLAKADVDDAIRAEIYKRAVLGEEEPVVSMGRAVYEEIPVLDKDGEPVMDAKGRPKIRRGKMLTHKRKSDILLMFHAKARMAEYRDKGPTIVNVLPKEYLFNAEEDGIER